MEESYTNLTRSFVRLIKEKIEARDTTFFKKLADIKFWIPRTLDFKCNEQNKRVWLTAPDGRKFVPAFLQEESSLLGFKGEQLIQIPYKRLVGLVADSGGEINGIVIAPFEEHIVLDKNVLQNIDTQTTRVILERCY